MDWETYEKFNRRAKLPEKCFFTEFVTEDLQRLCLLEPSSITLEIGYAHKRRIFVDGSIKTGDVSQRLEGNLIWEGKDKGIKGHLKLKPPLDRESLWKEYSHHIDLYKYYLEIGLKANVFFYAILGAILSIILTRDIPQPNIRLGAFSLCIPIIMSLGFGYMFVRGAKLWEQVRWTINVIKAQLNIEKAPEVRVLTELLLIFGGIFLFVGFIILPFMIYLISIGEAPVFY